MTEGMPTWEGTCAGQTAWANDGTTWVWHFDDVPPRFSVYVLVFAPAHYSSPSEHVGSYSVGQLIASNLSREDAAQLAGLVLKAAHKATALVEEKCPGRWKKYVPEPAETPSSLEKV